MGQFIFAVVVVVITMFAFEVHLKRNPPHSAHVANEQRLGAFFWSCLGVGLVALAVSEGGVLLVTAWLIGVVAFNTLLYMLFKYGVPWVANLFPERK